MYFNEENTLFLKANLLEKIHDRNRILNNVICAEIRMN